MHIRLRTAAILIFTRFIRHFQNLKKLQMKAAHGFSHKHTSSGFGPWHIIIGDDKLPCNIFRPFDSLAVFEADDR